MRIKASSKKDQSKTVSVIEIIISMKEEINELYHFLKVELFVFVELECFSGNLNANGCFSTVTSKDYFSIFVNYPCFNH